MLTGEALDAAVTALPSLPRRDTFIRATLRLRGDCAAARSRGEEALAIEPGSPIAAEVIKLCGDPP